MSDDCTCGGACGHGASGGGACGDGVSGGGTCGGGTCGCGGACGGHDERLAPAPLHNPPGRTALDYRVGEYGSFLAAQLDRLASPAYPALKGLTVRTPDDPAIGLLDATAVLGDLLTFHSERIADEAYLRTANEHRSLALLGRLVGHRPRPGVAASTHLAYSLERDPRAETLPVVIPRGAQSHSVPASADEESQTFETSRDLTARWDWNDLKVRRRRPSLVTPTDLERRSELLSRAPPTLSRPAISCSSSSVNRRAPSRSCCPSRRCGSTGTTRSPRSAWPSRPRPLSGNSSTRYGGGRPSPRRRATPATNRPPRRSPTHARSAA